MNGEVDTDRSRISKRVVLVAALALTVISGIAVAVDVLELIPLVTFPCLGWWAWRVFGINTLGMILLVVTLELVTGNLSIRYRSVGSLFDLLLFVPLFVLSVVCMLGSIVVFLVKASEPSTQRRRNLLAAAAACLLPIVWFLHGGWGAGMLAEWQLQRDIARCGLSEVITELNAATERLGRAPKDEREAVQLLGRPFPVLPKWGHIRYAAVGGKHFVLSLGVDIGVHVFDNEKPDKGWHLGEIPSAPDVQNADDGDTHSKRTSGELGTGGQGLNSE